MKYLVIDACLHGTGIRDKFEGYVSVSDLYLSTDLIEKINRWLVKYEKEYYNGFINFDIINELDNEGVDIAKRLKKEKNNYKIEYFSAGKMTREII